MKFGEKNKQTDPPQAEALSEPTAEPPEPAAAADEERPASDEAITEKSPSQSFYEKDNQAVRIQRLSQANDFWSEYEKRRPAMPFLRYVFDTQLQAEEALLAVLCIHRAEDTGHLICTEPITMGCYRLVDGRYEVFLAGDKLNPRTWSEATEKFSAAGGHYLNQLRPETYERFKNFSQGDQIVSKKDYYEITLAGTTHYQVFEASSLMTAKNFLLRPENVISDPDRFIHVVTPKGTLCRDIDGIHELE